MSEPAISVRNLSKCYRLGSIGRHTLVEEVEHWWHKVRGRDPAREMGVLGPGSATEQRRVEAEIAGEERFWALRDVSFDVQPGEVVGLIGRNGTGKSTLLKILSRITEPTGGEAIINGRVVSLLEVGTGFHPELTGRENIFMNGVILGMKRAEIAAKFDEIVAFAELRAFIDTPVKRYSSGMYVRLAFSVAAHLDPEILLVDEVLAVGDMEFQKKCLGKMQDVSESGRTILFVSHNMPAVARLCSRAVLLGAGSILKIGATDDVVATYTETAVGASAVRTWPVERQPGEGGFRLLEMRLENARGGPVNEVGDAFRVIVRYALSEESLKFRCAVSLYTQGVCAFTTVQPHEVTHERAGLYETAVFVPPHLLAEGEYLVGLSVFSSRGRKSRLCRVADALAFHLVDKIDGRSARGDYVEGLGGVMRPKLEWDRLRPVPPEAAADRR